MTEDVTDAEVSVKEGVWKSGRRDDKVCDSHDMIRISKTEKAKRDVRRRCKQKRSITNTYPAVAYICN
jgi:hypothetical protein